MIIYDNVCDGHTDIIKRNVPSKYDKNHADEFDNSLLYLASANGQMEIAQYLISLGAEINQKNKAGLIPLTVSLYRGQLEIAKLLIEHGANINHRNDDNKESVLEILQKDGYNIRECPSKDKRDFIEYVLKYEGELEKEIAEGLKKLRLELLFQE
jgi:ankyrin repeat protein